MKKFTAKHLGFVFVGILTLAIGSIVAFGLGSSGDGGRGGRGHGFGKDGFPPAFMIDRIAKELGLSEEQKTQAKQILDDSKTRVEPLFETMKQNHEATKNLGVDGSFDEAKVNELANNQAETMKQIFVEKEKTKAQLFAILTDEQKVKAKEMLDKFGDRMKGGFKRGHKGEPKSEE